MIVSVLDLVGVTSADVVLLDVGMPGPGVPDLVGRIGEINSKAGIVVLSMSDDPDFVRALMHRGVRGFLSTNANRHDLVAAVRTVARPGHIMVSMSSEGAGLLFANSPGRLAEQRLSQREVEVLTLAAQALSNVQIALRLGTTEGTVKRHLRNIFGKLGAVSRIDAVNRGIVTGIVPAPYAGGRGTAEGSSRPGA